MTTLRRVVAFVALAASVSLGACAPTNTNSIYTGADLGRTAQVSYGVIVSMRPVVVQNQSSGIGTLGGAAVGGVAGSFIGRNDVRGNILGAVGGALLGGLAGTVIEASARTGNAVEFIIQESGASEPISVVQTNEDNFRPGDRIVLTRGARTRIGHVGA